MAQTAAERARKYRAKRDADPTKRAEYLEKEKNRWHRNVAVGKIKTVATMTDREHRKAKKTWKDKMRKYRQKKKGDPVSLTPPSTPDQQADELPVAGPSRQYQQATKKRKREAAKCYRRISELEESLKNQRRLTEKYKKRAQRSEAKNQEATSLTPRSKTRRLLRNFQAPAPVVKTLNFHHAFMDNLKGWYSQKKKSEKRSLSVLVRGPILKKYRMQRRAKQQLGIKSNSSKSSRISHVSHALDGYVLKRYGNKIREFYEQDD